MSRSDNLDTQLSANQFPMSFVLLQLPQNPIADAGGILQCTRQQFNPMPVFPIPHQASVLEIRQPHISTDLTPNTNKSFATLQHTRSSRSSWRGQNSCWTYRPRARFTQSQVDEMRRVFQRQHYISQEDCMQLAQRIGLTTQQVSTPLTILTAC